MVRILAIVLLVMGLLPSVALAQSSQAAYLAAIHAADQEMRENLQTINAAVQKPEGADRLVVGLALAGTITAYDDARKLEVPSGRVRSHALWLEGQRLYRDAALALVVAVYGFTPESRAENLNEARMLLDQATVLITLHGTVWAQGY